jgi:hypothetical protein
MLEGTRTQQVQDWGQSNPAMLEPSGIGDTDG